MWLAKSKFWPMSLSVEEEFINYWELSRMSCKLSCIYFLWNEFSCKIYKSSSSINWSSPYMSSKSWMKPLTCIQQSSISSKEGYWSFKCSWNTVWKYLREYKLSDFYLSYRDCAFPSKLTMSIFIKESSYNFSNLH